MGKSKGGKRDFSADTRAMAGFAKTVFYISGWADGFDEQVREMNEGKAGRRYAYPDSLFTWAVVLRAVLGTSYRFTLGIVNLFLSRYNSTLYF